MDSVPITHEDRTLAPEQAFGKPGRIEPFRRINQPAHTSWFEAVSRINVLHGRGPIGRRRLRHDGN
jgi:hypothetical protein